MHYPIVQRKVKESQVTARFYDQGRDRTDQRTFFIPGWYNTKTDRRLIANIKHMCIASSDVVLVEVVKIRCGWCIYRMRLLDFMAYADAEHDFEEHKEHKRKNERKF